jgi:hypothetical protein
MENEIPKYKKRSLKPTTKKSKHKHLYEECLLIDVNEKVCRATYCLECGKIGNLFILETTDDVIGKYRRMLNKKEIMDKYKDLPKKYVDDILKANNISLL